MGTMIAERGIEPWRRRLFLPAYRIRDAARYARTSPQNVPYWHYGGGTLGPALPGREQRRPLSYMELVEVAFVAVFRGFGVSLQRIRRAREYVAQTFNAEYPFVEYRFKTEGQHTLLEFLQQEPDAALNRLVVADGAGQLAWENMMADKFAEFDYEYDLALVWHPAGRQSLVTINPRIAFGAPTVRGVPTWVLKGRYLAGESLEDLKGDFGLEEEDSKHGLQFEGIRLAA